MKVLIIDDSPTIREIVKIYLMNEGCTFEEAADGEAGLALLSLGEFQLVLADYKMPRLNGLGLLQAVRGSARTAKLPLIILTGEKGPEVRAAVIEAGATEVLNKPISAAALQAAVRKVRDAKMSASARQVLEARARALAERQDAAAKVVASLTLFRLGSQLYAARAADVDGAGQLREMSPVPGAPAWLLGATLFRGAVISLVDLLALWGAPAPGIRDLPSFVVLAHGGRRLGVLVDQLLGNLELEGEVQAYQGPAHAGLVELARRDGQPVPVLSAAALLAEPRLKP